jgi:hypothetical protein
MNVTDSTILIGYDGSDDATAAIRGAGALLAPRPAIVTHVWESFSESLLNTQAHGSVWRTVHDTARAQRAAAVVVGSRGRSAMGATLMGSVSRALVHEAPAPVLVVRPPS